MGFCSVFIIHQILSRSENAISGSWSQYGFINSSILAYIIYLFIKTSSENFRHDKNVIFILKKGYIKLLIICLILNKFENNKIYMFRIC